jgi:hypothetical protein
MRKFRNIKSAGLLEPGLLSPCTGNKNCPTCHHFDELLHANKPQEGKKTNPGQSRQTKRIRDLKAHHQKVRKHHEKKKKNTKKSFNSRVAQIHLSVDSQGRAEMSDWRVMWGDLDSEPHIEEKALRNTINEHNRLSEVHSSLVNSYPSSPTSNKLKELNSRASQLHELAASALEKILSAKKNGQTDLANKHTRVYQTARTDALQASHDLGISIMNDSL